MSGELQQYYEIDPKTAGCWRRLKKICLSWCRVGKTAMGNIFASYIIKKEMKAVP
jgi:hypothetical protein